ncbi:Uncharacterized protein GBIM_00181 [Gryllus bimaculatus]|nr:Uncharacterized protein GBIM_00181 [Gryllus bimaculatus]
MNSSALEEIMKRSMQQYSGEAGVHRFGHRSLADDVYKSTTVAENKFSVIESVKKAFSFSSGGAARRSDPLLTRTDAQQATPEGGAANSFGRGDGVAGVSHGSRAVHAGTPTPPPRPRGRLRLRPRPGTLHLPSHHPDTTTITNTSTQPASRTPRHCRIKLEPFQGRRRPARKNMLVVEAALALQPTAGEKGVAVVKVLLHQAVPRAAVLAFPPTPSPLLPILPSSRLCRFLSIPQSYLRSFPKP